MNDELHFGVLLPTGKAQWGEGTDPRQLFELAVRAEQLGFASVWVNDTLLSPRIEGLSMLAALAPLTNRIKLGTATLMPVLHRATARGRDYRRRWDRRSRNSSGLRPSANGVPPLLRALSPLGSSGNPYHSHIAVHHYNLAVVQPR